MEGCGGEGVKKSAKNIFAPPMIVPCVFLFDLGDIKTPTERAKKTIADFSTPSLPQPPPPLPSATKASAFVASGSKGSETKGHRERTMCEIKTVAHTPLCVESVFFRGFHSFRDHPGWRGLSTPREAKVVAYPGVVIPELN